MGGKFYLAMITIACFLLGSGSAIACPSCKDHLAANGLDVAYASTIGLMIAMPLLIVAGWAVAIMLVVRRSKVQPIPSVEAPK